MVAIKQNGKILYSLGKVISLSFKVAISIIFTCIALLSAGCSSSDDSGYVKKGDPFFDDAMLRLTPSERKNLQSTGPEYLRGFLFMGTHKTCVVIISVRDNLISHGAAPAFCYKNGSHEFVERL